MRILVALPQARTPSKGGHRPASLDAAGVSSSLGPSQYRRLFSSTPCPKKVGPKGPSDALIQAIVKLKSRNPRFGCPRIARIIVHGGAVTGADLCRMFNAAIHGQGVPRHLSTDHDPLFEAHRWTANLRILEIGDVKTVPHVPVSHPSWSA